MLAGASLPIHNASGMDLQALALDMGNVDLLATVAAMARGEHPALRVLFQHCADRVYSVALRLLRLPEDAEEVVSDVFQQAWRDASRFDAGRGSVEAWLLKIAHSRSIDRLRRRAARPDEGAELHPDQAPGAYTACEETQTRMLELYESGGMLHRALSNLSAEQHRCIGLAFMEGLSHQEIAERLEWPLGTVKSHVRRGMLALRNQLEAWGYEHEPN